MRLASRILIGIVLLVGIGILAHVLYERHLSPDVRAAVLASLGDHTSEADIAIYLRTAKLATRTKRDSYIVGLLDKVVALASESERNQRESWDLVMSDLRSAVPVECQVYGLGAPRCKTALVGAAEEGKRHQEMEKVYDANAQTEATEATRLLGILRAELGLPPLQTRK